VTHDGYIPRYRLRLYELLGEVDDIEYVVFHGPPPQQNAALPMSGPFPFSNVEVRNHELRLGSKALVWQGLFRQIALGGFDALVMGAFLRFASGLALFPAMKLTRRPVILWGQGGEKEEDSSPLMRPLLRAGASAKGRIARIADGYLVYTDAGADLLAARGVRRERVFVVRNTIDMAEQITLQRELADAGDAELRAELGLQPDSAVLLYVGRLYSEKRVEELLKAARTLNADAAGIPPVEVVVIGDGPQGPAIEREAARDPRIHIKGEISDQRVVARHMAVAAAVVIPGKVGLAVNHAFGHGVPVITTQSRLHAPEFGYLSHGENGLVADSMDELPAVLASFLAAPEAQRELAAGALAARESLSIEEMARSFDRGVRSVLEGRSRRNRPLTR
jgi:glycosyltransferase involved in cell wall biosynthesis